MLNLQDFIANGPFEKKVKVDELLFAEYKCPGGGKPIGAWWENNFFAYLLTGKMLLKTPGGEYLINRGDAYFAKKGSVIAQTYIDEDFCELLIFMPDDFIKTVVKKYGLQPAAATSQEPADTIIKLNNDPILTTYFESLFTHFHQPGFPSHALLKLKFEELLLNIFSGKDHSVLKQYFSQVTRMARPSIKEIMETNFASNCSLEEFARLCSRGLSTFKKEFKAIFKMTPGKWLLEKRLGYSRFLLETTDQSVDEIIFESGFENRSHFDRVFKNKYGSSAARYRLQKRRAEPAMY